MTRTSPATQIQPITPMEIPACSPGERAVDCPWLESGGMGMVPFEEEGVGLGEAEGCRLVCGFLELVAEDDEEEVMEEVVVAVELGNDVGLGLLVELEEVVAVDVAEGEDVAEEEDVELVVVVAVAEGLEVAVADALGVGRNTALAWRSMYFQPVGAWMTG